MALPSHSRRGFTMLEMIIALFIVSLLLGMAVKTTRNTLAHEEIRQADRKLQILARTARKQAFEENRPWQIVLRADSWTLLPFSEIENREKDSSPPEPKTVGYKLSDQVHWQVKSWGSTAWTSPGELAWVFTPNGLCTPLRFRLTQQDSWMEMAFNPLTANVQDEEFYLP